MYFVWLAAVATPAVMYYIWQTALLNKRNIVVKNLEAIDEVLKLRLELIPKLINACSKIAKLDKSLVKEIEAILKVASTDYNKYSRDEVSDHLLVHEKLNYRVGRLIINADASNRENPDPLVTQAIMAYEETENKISVVRKAYNESAADLNMNVAQFPSSMVADIVKISAMPIFNGEHLSTSQTDEKDF